MEWMTLPRAIEKVSATMKVVRKGKVLPYKVSKINSGWLADDLHGAYSVITEEFASQEIWKPHLDVPKLKEDWWDK